MMEQHIEQRPVSSGSVMMRLNLHHFGHGLSHHPSPGAGEVIPAAS